MAIVYFYPGPFDRGYCCAEMGFSSYFTKWASSSSTETEANVVALSAVA